MRVNKCDYCGTETQAVYQWIFLTRPWPRHPEIGIITMGREELEYCSAQCVIDYLTKERDGGL